MKEKMCFQKFNHHESLENQGFQKVILPIKLLFHWEAFLQKGGDIHYRNYDKPYRFTDYKHGCNVLYKNIQS